MNTLLLHDHHLEKLWSNYESIGESRKDIRWCMRNGLWLHNNSYSAYKLCDLVNVYYDDHVSLIELKRSRKQRDKALLQLRSSEKFVIECLGIEDIIKKIVYYSGGQYNMEVI